MGAINGILMGVYAVVNDGRLLIRSKQFNSRCQYGAQPFFSKAKK